MPTQNEYIDQLERLWGLVSEAVEEGRITPASTPDDHPSLVHQMEKCEAARPSRAVPSDLHTEKMAVISTGHLPYHEARVIPSGLSSGTVVGMEREEGFLVSTTCTIRDEAPELPQMAAILRFFRETGFEWVLFDRDADEVEAFPVHEW